VKLGGLSGPAADKTSLKTSFRWIKERKERQKSSGNLLEYKVDRDGKKKMAVGR